MPFHVAQLLGLLLGLLLGSFLNVCIARVPRGESVVQPASHCPVCSRPIRLYDNIPLLSWIFLRARCRDCHNRISWRYPAVELAFGLWMANAASMLWKIWQRSADGTSGLHATASTSIFASIDVVGFAILGFLLIGLVVMDWQTQLLPNAFTWGGIAAGMFLICIQAVFLGPTQDEVLMNSSHQIHLSSPGSSAATGNMILTGPESLIFGRLAAVCGAALLLLLVRWGYRAIRKRDGLGLGDVKMLAMIAAFLGLWPALLTLFAGVLLASFYGTALLLRGRANALTRLPLGSFLGVAGLLAALYSERVFAWYFSLF